MRGHSQTIDHRPQVGVPISVSGLDWLQRLHQWFKGFVHHQREIPPLSSYGTWEPERERFHPLRADAALDIVISERGPSWATRLHNSSL